MANMTANRLSVIIEARSGKFRKDMQKVINSLTALGRHAIKTTATVTKAFKMMKTAIGKLEVGYNLEEALNKAVETATNDQAFDRLLVEIGLIGDSTEEATRRAKLSFEQLAKNIGALAIGKRIKESIEPELKETENLMGKISEKIKEIGVASQSASKMVSKAFKSIRKSLLLLAVLDVLKKSIETAVKASEMDRLFKRMLGDYAEETYKWSKEVSKSLNILDTAVRKDTQVIYTMVKTLGIGEEAALKMSKGVAILSQDMASFYDIDPATAFDKIQSGLTGIGAPLKELGIIIDDNIVKQTAYKKGLVKVGQELTTQQKVVARYMAIMEQTASAHGHLSRNLDTTSNKLRKCKVEIYEFLKVVGTIIKPFVDAILAIFRVVMKVVNAILKAVSWLFGFDIYASIHKETEKISDNANSIADGMGDAAENAKKLKKYLASFDEIENLNMDEQEDDENVGPILEVPNLEEYNDGLNKIVDGIGNRLKKVSNPSVNILLSDSEASAWLDNYNDGIVKATSSTDKFNEALSSTALINDVLNNKLLFPVDRTNSPMLHTSYELPQDEKPVENPILTYTENLLKSDATKEWFEQYNAEIAKATESTEEFNEVVADNALLNNALNGGLLFPTDTSNSTTLKDASSDEKSSSSDSVEGQPELKGFAKIKDEVTKKWKEIKKEVDDSTTSIVTDVETKWDNIKKATSTKWDDVKKVTSTKWDDVKKQATEKWTGVKDTVVNNCTEVKDKVTTKWEEVKKGTSTKYEEIKTAATEKWTTIKKEIEDKVTEITGNIEEKWESIKTSTSTKWDEIKTSTSTKWDEIKTAVAEKVTGTKSNIEEKWEEVKTSTSTKWDDLKKEASNKWGNIKKIVADKVVETKGSIEEKWDGVKGIFSSLVTYLDNTFIKDFDKPLTKITTTMKKTKDSIVDTTKTMINWIIDGLNKMIRGINKIHIDIPEWLGGGTLGFNIPELPRLARGGIVSSPTIAMIGEAGKEAVVPLENNTGWIDKLASKIAVMLAAMRANEDNRPINVNITTELNGKVVSKELIRDLNKEARRLGYKPLLAT